MASYTLYNLEDVVALEDTITSKSSSASFLIIMKEDAIQELIILEATKGYGDRVNNKFWLKQFKGMQVNAVNRDVDAISGATLVSDDIKEGVLLVARDYLK